tara:strand:+ start:1372 stop:1587 length:216 start_codon:yes stop_codon:yes gene_type:complete
MQKTPNELKSEAFEVLAEIRLRIEVKQNQLLQEGFNELEVESRLLYSKEVQKRSRKKVLKALESNRYIKLN